MSRRTRPIERFKRLFKPDHETGCWEWQGARTSNGYPKFGLGGRGVTGLAHRWAYQYFVGPIPEGLQLDHLCHTRDTSCEGGPTCRHRRCVRPDHLEPVTPGVNQNRGKAGEKNAAKTHCPKGHEYTEANTYRYPNGRRDCVTCRTASQRRWYEKKYPERLSA